jgi:CRISPR-associated protein Csb2
MTTIRLTFPAARYHATPWGRHVNEGTPEWPPSPYRLLRALYDVWRRKCEDLPEDSVREVLEALALDPPRFHLPPAVATHTRSYLNANSKDPTDKNLVFDPFLVFDRPHGCYLSWPAIELSPRQRDTLGQLLANLNFLGRSESWVQAEPWDGPVTGILSEIASTIARSGESVPVACVVSPVDFNSKKGTWMDALTYSTANLLKERASAPPLLRMLRYARPENALIANPVRQLSRHRMPVQAVVLGLDSTVLPLVTTTIEVAEQVRKKLMGAHKRRMGGDPTQLSEVFSGKTPDGAKRLDHGHLYILPLGNKHGRIDCILLLNPLRPFTPDELDAVRGVRELYQRDGRPGVRCVVTWQGALDGGGRHPSPVVVSATPFVPPRHWRKGRDHARFIEEEVRRECRNHHLGVEPETIEPLKHMPGLFDGIEYRRNRKDDPVRPGYALRLTFRQPVLAPFSIGYGAHFGLGQFRPPE